MPTKTLSDAVSEAMNVLAQWCPACNADPWEPCRYKSHQPSVWHEARKNEARKAQASCSALELRGGDVEELMPIADPRPWRRSTYPIDFPCPTCRVPVGSWCKTGRVYQVTRDDGSVESVETTRGSHPARRREADRWNASVAASELSYEEDDL